MPLVVDSCLFYAMGTIISATLLDKVCYVPFLHAIWVALAAGVVEVRAHVLWAGLARRRRSGKFIFTAQLTPPLG